VYGGWTFLSGQLERRRAIAQLLSSEAVRLSAGDYASAWKTLEQAASIDAGSGKVQHAQEDVAMQWLENIRVSGNHTFSEITEKLEPVLTRGATSAKSLQRQADLLSHLGWSYFLRRRDSPSGPAPESAYRDALQKDPSNPYAHAMWGHWILWNHQGFAKANEQFAAALASPRNVRPYVRGLQISALMNVHSSHYEEETIRVANAIRKEHGDLSPDRRSSILYIYTIRMVPLNGDTPAFLNALPPVESLATFDWLAEKTDAGDSDGLRSYCRSRLLEAAGRTDEALASYRSLQAQFTPDRSGALLDATRQAIGRLTAK
jgi:tetratricopeptide (TPR) repeat protein